MRLSDEEKAWVAIARALPPDRRRRLIEAAEAIAEGRPPPLPAHTAAHRKTK